MKNSLQAVVFDLYNTLIYLAEETRPYLRLLQDLSLSPKENEQARTAALTEEFDSFSEFVRKIKPGLAINVESYESETKKEIASARLYPETISVLEELKKRGLRIGLISNLASSYKAPFFSLGLEKYFENIIFSCEVGLEKPDPRIYKRILQEMNIPPYQALMVGDKMDRDVLPPLSVGMNAVLIDRSNQIEYQTKIKSLDGIFGFL